MYHEGVGTPRSSRSAFEWLTKAARQDAPEAQFLVGWARESGDGAEIDSQKMFDWYRKAAAQGFHPAKVRLAIAYANGNGTGRNVGEAHYWLSSALRDGNPSAAARLEALEKPLAPRTIAKMRTESAARLRRETKTREANTSKRGTAKESS